MRAMHSILRQIITHPLFVLLVVAAAAFGGLYGVRRMPVDLFPGLDVPVVNVIAHHPGAGPEEMELLVTRSIEDRMRGIPGVKRVSSSSIQGISLVTVQFGWGTRLTDARQLVQAELAAVQGNLPAGVEPSLENIGTTLQEVVGYVVYGGEDPVALRSAIRVDVASRLMEAEGVSRVTVLGGEERAFIVKVNSSALSRSHLTVNDLIQTLRRNNLAAAEGYLERGSREYSIRGDAMLKTIEDIRCLPVVSEGPKSVLLGSIATVSEGYNPRHYVVHGDGIPAVAFFVEKQRGASTVRVVREVDRRLAELKTLLPVGARLKKFYDQSEIIVEARNALMEDLALGAVLVVVVLYFFLGTMRATLIVAATIPMSLLTTAMLMAAFGLTLNVVTLSAMTLVVGMVVDDAIVVAENIFRHLELKKNAAEASVEGGAEIAAADASGTFTTVAAFVPLLLVGGIASLFLKPFGLVVSVALLVSLALSLTFVPVAFSRWDNGMLVADAPGGRLLRGFDRGLQGLLRLTFARPWSVLIAGLLFLSLGGLAVFLGPAAVLPPVDEGAILIEYVMPEGTALAESDRVGEALEQIALSEPDVSCVYRRTGSATQGFQVEGVNRGEIMIKLKSRSVRRRSADQVMERLRTKYEKMQGLVFLYHQPTQEKMDESLSGLPAMFGVTIFGPDMNELVRLADRVENMMAADRAVSNIVNNTKIKTPQIIVHIDYPKLAQYRIRADDILTTVQATRFGVEGTRIVRQREEVHVLLKVEAPINSAVTSLGGLLVNTPDGDLVPLERLAKMQIAHTAGTITRLNGQREVTLLAEVSGSIPAAVSCLRHRFAAISLPASYHIEFTGQYRVLMQTLFEMGIVVLGAIVLMYLIIVLLSHSWLQPLIILLTIPFSLVGATAALALARQAINVSVGMGILTLVGIAVNNAIVLLDYANTAAIGGQSMPQALLFAASVRLRPILLTSLTTIFALIPVVISPAVGSKIFQPFAVTVIGGLTSATAATLVVIPTLARVLAPKGPAPSGE